MATITMVFPDPLNVSLQIGDTAYYVPTNTHGGFLTSLNSGATAEETIVEIGAVASITQNTNTNLSTMLGYYAEVKFSNNSTTEAELFTIGADIFESIK